MGVWVWKFGDALKVTASLNESEGRWNSKNGVLEIYLNYYDGDKYSPIRSWKSVGRALAWLFNAKGGKWICDIADSAKSRRHKDVIKTRVAFYCVTHTIPTENQMERVREVVGASLVPSVYIGTDKVTGETTEYCFKEMDRDYPNALTALNSESFQRRHNGKKWTQYGKYWEEL